MKIELTTMQTANLAREFAQTIRCQVLEQRLAHVEGLHFHPRPGSGFSEVQQAIRSIRHPIERRTFIYAIRIYFGQLREEMSTPIRGRDYVAGVHAYRTKHGLHTAA